MHPLQNKVTALARWIVVVSLTTASALASPTTQQQRTRIPPGGSNWVPRSQAVPGLVTRDMAAGGETPTSLVQALVGTDVVISNVQYVGAPLAGGTFSGGTGIIGFQQGVILSSGNVASVVGPQNLQPDTSTDNLGLGDADLDALVGGLTEDAASLEFDFECPSANVISFQYAFTSEEYDEWVNTQYNDVFAFFLNGVNIALIPNTGAPVAINNVNCGNPYDPTGGTNCVQYVTNDCDSMGLGFPCANIPMELDGKTVVFSATGDLQAGTNHIKLVIADRGDRVYDSDVFIRGTSFVCAPPGPAFDPPTPCGQTLTAAVGSPCHFEVDALATNGLPDEAVTLTVSGDSVPLAGGVFVPPLPVGPAPEVRTEFDWTPLPADAGTWHLQFEATDQVGQVSYCIVTIQVPAPSFLNFCVPGVNGVMPCPCSNSGDLGHGCDNSTGTGGALLEAFGAARLGADTLHFTSSFERATAFSVLMQARGPTHLGIKFGQGVRCVSSTIKRLYAHSAVAGSVVFPQGADVPVSQRSALKGDALAAGETRYYLSYYRDPIVQGSCNPATDTFNASQGMSVLWVP
jgi:hypothetical protein